MTKEIDKKIGKKLKAQRIMRGISQVEIGNVLNLSFQQIQKYEKAKNRISVSTFLELVKFLEVDPAKFINDLVNENKEAN
jgi:transcriptional regulator with XRE-family HTH domain